MILVFLDFVPPPDNRSRLDVAQWVFGASWHRRKSFRDGVVPCRAPVWVMVAIQALLTWC